MSGFLFVSTAMRYALPFAPGALVISSPYLCAQSKNAPITNLVQQNEEQSQRIKLSAYKNLIYIGLTGLFLTTITFIFPPITFSATLLNCSFIFNTVISGFVLIAGIGHIYQKKKDLSYKQPSLADLCERLANIARQKGGKMGNGGKIPENALDLENIKDEASGVAAHWRLHENCVLIYKRLERLSEIRELGEKLNDWSDINAKVNEIVALIQHINHIQNQDESLKALDQQTSPLLQQVNQLMDEIEGLLK